MRFVDIDLARSASGVRLVVVKGVPSPWSEAAKGIFVVKGIDGLLVRASPPDDAVRQWTGSHNAPVLMLDGDPPRTHWSEILEAAERIGGSVKLVPDDPEQRIRMFGAAHELLGEGGLAWSARLLAVHRGLTTEGREGFPLRVARYIGAKYGYAPDRMDDVKARVVALLGRVADMAEANRARGSDYLLGDSLTALDIYAAAALAVLSPPGEAQCVGMHPAIRHAFATGAPDDVRAALPGVLREHRDLVYKRHLGAPVEL
jgi:glutathione S-transferase